MLTLREYNNTYACMRIIKNRNTYTHAVLLCICLIIIAYHAKCLISYSLSLGHCWQL